ncbi:hypothetical protein Syun_007556 [Stephania yunnanensis]|uniref:Alpha/beta hydrolase fold-3 domain-containing protein n=1 Tax=Stephania yunnanensis TaxID=152371 RepID=A0AAP0PZF8_9MAGN
MATTDDEIASELLPLLRVYKSGRVERLLGSPIVPPSPQGDPHTGVSSKDITIKSPSISARLYLPTTTQKLHILFYFHGGAFCIESAFSSIHHRYLSLLSARASALVVSIEYRLAPEHHLPAAYHDAWDSFLWLLSHSSQEILTDSSNVDHQQQEQWVLNHGDFDRLFIGGDSAGANLAHDVAMRVGSTESKTRIIRGVLLSQPYFWGSARMGIEKGRPDDSDFITSLWLFTSGGAGLDDPMINPFAKEAPSLAGLGCFKVLMCVAGDDILKERGKAYYEELKKSGWDGDVELFEVEGEGHAFHALDTDSENSKLMIGRLASFLNQ